MSSSTTQVKERPILFNAEMVRAVLAGRKTQTRRVVKRPATHEDTPETTAAFVRDREQWLGAYGSKHASDLRLSHGDWNVWTAPIPCPYGVTGDRLWGREAWRPVGIWEGREGISYRADDGFEAKLPPDPPMIVPIGSRRIWRPSIHMPRWASRILLEVTDVRVERVQEISESDAMAEGTVYWSDSRLSSDRGLDKWARRAVVNAKREGRDCPGSAGMRDAFSLLWDSTTKPGQQWADNPWVWCVSFKVLEGGADHA